MAAKKGLIQEFKEFVASGDLMSFAVAFIMAALVKDLIASFIENIFSGIIGLFAGCDEILDAAGKKIGEDCTGLTSKAWKSVKYGAFINQIVTFLMTAFVVFMMVKAYKKATGKGLAQDGPSDNDLLKEIRDELKANNGR